MCMAAWGLVNYAFKGGVLDRVCKKLTLLGGPSEDAVQYVDVFIVLEPQINYGAYSQQYKLE